MMKKTLTIFFVLIFFIFFSCTKHKSYINEETQKEPVGAETLSSEIGNVIKESAPKIDYDLSNMNYNMLSAVTFEMLIEPEKYADKTVKISGQFYTEVEEAIRYYSVIIWDATLCCPAGMDFIPPDTMTFPDDFPPEETTITVTGTLHENTEDGNLLFYANKIEF